VIPSHAPSRISGLRPVCRKLPSLRGKSPLLRGFADFYQRFFGETPSQNLARPRSNINWGSQTRKRLQRPAPLKRNWSSMLRSAYPPGGTPLDSLIPPQGACGRGQPPERAAEPSSPGGQLLGPPPGGRSVRDVCTPQRAQLRESSPIRRAGELPRVGSDPQGIRWDCPLACP
jgi:hypothetical protein